MRSSIKSAKSRAMAIAKAASAKKAQGITLIDMREVPTVCDFFLIASGSSTTQVKAIADNIYKKLKEKGERPLHTEGERESLWILIDYGDVVAHVFLDSTRRFYDLERLWQEMPQTPYREPRPRKKKVSHSRKRKKT